MSATFGGPPAPGRQPDRGLGQAALEALYWRSEILQALFWMRGEGLADIVDPLDLAAFLAADPPVIHAQLEGLARDGYLERAPGRLAAYRLSPLGVSEGGRSFADEFEGLTHAGHGECAPGCWCRDPRRAGEPCPSLEA